MNTDFLDTHLMAYLSLREALGFQMRAEKIILPEFVAYVKAQERTGPLRAQVALEWACQESAHRGPSGAARRLSMARDSCAILRPLCQLPRCQLQVCSPLRDGQSRLSSHHCSSRRSSRPLKPVNRVELCVPTPSRPYLGCWLALACGWARPPLTRRSGQTGSASTAVTHPGNEVPQITHCAAAPQHRRAPPPRQ